MPLNYEIPEDQFMEFNKHPFCWDNCKEKLNFNTDSGILSHLGATGTKKIPHSHILDLFEENPNTIFIN